jgi:hypothetical protein
MKRILLGVILFPLLAVGGIAPRQSYWSDTSQQPRERSLRFVQASSQDLQWTFSNTVSSAQNLTGATSVIFGYAPESRAWSVVVTGAVSSAANGQVLVSFTPANLNTNGLFDWVLQVNAGSTSTLAYAYGKLQIVPDPLSGITNSLTQTTYINWSLYTFANTYTEGPVRVTGAVGVTTNSDGSVTYDVTDPVVSISGSSPIGITTSGTDRTVYLQASSVTGLVGSAIESGTVADARIASTIARDSEVSTATGLTYAAAVAYSDSLAANYATAAQGVSATDALARVTIVEPIVSALVTDVATRAVASVVNTQVWSDAQYPNAVLRDGSRAMTGNLNFGGFGATNLADGVAPKDATTVSQVQGMTNTLQAAINAANERGTNSQARCTLLEQTPIILPFIATNATYDTTWFLRPIADQTITQIIAKCDAGTGAVWFVRQALTDEWRTFATTNVISVSTTGDYYTTSMTITNGTMFGYQYKGGTCTQGVFFVYSQ